MKRQPDDLEVSILTLFGREPLNRHGARRVKDVSKQMPAGSMSEDDLTGALSDMIRAGWLKGKTLPGPGGVAADIVDIDITGEGDRVLEDVVGVNVARQAEGNDHITTKVSSPQAVPSPDSAAPKCFISYSWDSEDHKTWVRKLAEGLRANHVDAILDQWNLIPGSDLAHFMEGASQTDFVVVVCTPEYAQKANAGEAGVGYEKRIITARLRREHPESGTIIPVVCSGEQDAVPSFLADLQYIDFSEDGDFDRRLEELLRAIYHQPACVAPPLGPKPCLQTLRPAYTRPGESTKHRPPVVPGTKSRIESLNPLRELEERYGNQPFYAIWAWPYALSSYPFDTQDSDIQNAFRNPPGRREEGYTLAYSTAHADIVQEGLRFSSTSQSLDLSDNGSMVFSADLRELIQDAPAHTIHPLPLIEYTASFVRTFSAMWVADCASQSLQTAGMHFNARICLNNVVGWELRPGTPGTGGYEHLYDIGIRPHQPLKSRQLWAPATEAYTFGLSDSPDLVSVALIRSIYSAFGYGVDDIPYYDPQRLVLVFRKGYPN